MHCEGRQARGHERLWRIFQARGSYLEQCLSLASEKWQLMHGNRPFDVRLGRKPTFRKMSASGGAKRTPTFHNIGSAKLCCRRKAKMSALSKVGMSVFCLLVVRF